MNRLEKWVWPAQRSIAAVLLGICLVSPSAVCGAVSLTAGSPVMTAPGEIFEIELRLLVTGADEVTGIDYYWMAGESLAGFLSLVGREFQAGEFPFVNFSNEVVLEPPGNMLDPENAFNLGGGVQNVNQPLGSGDWLVARYLFTVSEDAPPRTHLLVTMSLPGLGWVGSAAQGFPDAEFSQQASISVSIIPEPGVMALGILGLLLTGIRVASRRRGLFLR